mgnify:CR=1 FL=1
MLGKLLQVYADRRLIHVILDKCVIHSSRQTQAWLAERRQEVRLYFLPSFLRTALDHHTRNWLRDRSAQKRSPGAMADLDAVPPPADGHPAPDQAFEVT